MLGGLELVTPPTTWLVTVQELKDHLRLDLDDTDDDAYLAELIRLSYEYCSNIQGRAYLATTYRETYDRFPWGDAPFRLMRAPVQSITSVQYVDTDGVTQVLGASIYQLDGTRAPARLGVAYNESWPATREQMNAVIVTYVAGYANTDRVPRSVRQAIKMLAAAWYGCGREAFHDGRLISQPTPVAVETLLAQERMPVW